MARTTNRTLRVKVHTVGADQTAAAFKKVQAGGGGLEKTFKGVTRAAGALGVAMGGAAMLSAVKNASDAFGKFRLELDRLNTLIPGNKKLQDSLRGSIEGLSVAYGVNTNDAAKATFQAMSAGIAGDKAGQFMKVAAMNATAGFNSMEESVSGLTTVMNAYGLEVDEAMSVSDAMFTANKLGVTTSRELGASLGTVVSMAANTGVSYRELMSATVALTKSGVSTNESMTGLRAIIASMIQPSSDATAAAEELGVKWDVSVLKSKGLAGAVDILRKAMDKGGAELVSKLIPRVEGASKAMTLASKTGAADFTGSLKDMETQVGQTVEALTASESLARDQKRAAAELNAQWLKFGETVMPVVVGAMNALVGVLKEANDHFNITRKGVSEIKDQDAALESLARRLQDGRVGINEWVATSARWKKAGVDVLKALQSVEINGVTKYSAALDEATRLTNKAREGTDEYKAHLKALEDQVKAAAGQLHEFADEDALVFDSTTKTAPAVKKSGEASKAAGKAAKEQADETKRLNKELRDLFAVLDADREGPSPLIDLGTALDDFVAGPLDRGLKAFAALASGNIELAEESIGKLPEPLRDAARAMADLLVQQQKLAEANKEISESFDDLASGALSSFANGMAGAIDAVVSGQASFGAAMQNMANSVLRSIAKQATVKAIFQVAEALEDVAAGNIPAAQAHMFAAAKFGLIAGGGFAGGAAVGTSGGRGRGERAPARQAREERHGGGGSGRASSSMGRIGFGPTGASPSTTIVNIHVAGAHLDQRTAGRAIQRASAAADRAGMGGS